MAVTQGSTQYDEPSKPSVWDTSTGKQPAESQLWQDPKTGKWLQMVSGRWIEAPANIVASVIGTVTDTIANGRSDPTAGPAGMIAGAIGNAAGGPVGNAFGALAASQITGAQGNSPAAEVFKEQQRLQEELAAKQQGYAHQHQQIANRDIYRESEKEAMARGAAKNSQNLANKEASTGVAGAVDARVVEDIDPDKIRTWTDTHRLQGQTAEETAYSNRGEALTSQQRANAANEIKTAENQRNAATSQVSDAPTQPPAEQLPQVQAEQQSSDGELPEVIPEVQADPTNTQVSANAENAINDRLKIAMSGTDLQPGTDAYSTEYNKGLAALRAYVNGDASQWEQWQTKANASWAAKSPISKNPELSEFQGQKRTFEKRNLVNSSHGEITIGNSDMRIKNIKGIISDARLKKNKQRTQKIIPTIVRRF